MLSEAQLQSLFSLFVSYKFLSIHKELWVFHKGSEDTAPREAELREAAASLLLLLLAYPSLANLTLGEAAAVVVIHES